MAFDDATTGGLSLRAKAAIAVAVVLGVGAIGAVIVLRLRGPQATTPAATSPSPGQQPLATSPVPGTKPLSTSSSVPDDPASYPSLGATSNGTEKILPGIDRFLTDNEKKSYGIPVSAQVRVRSVVLEGGGDPYLVFEIVSPPSDRDGDGIPDDVEIARGLNPDVPDSFNGTRDSTTKTVK